MLFIGLFLDAAAEEQRVNLRVEALLRLAKANDIDFGWMKITLDVLFNFRIEPLKVENFLTSATVPWPWCIMLYFLGTLSPIILPSSAELMGKFKDVCSIHDFVKAQMVAGAKLALIWLMICHSKLDFGMVVDTFYL
jgi:hypothetical protein